MTNTPRTWEERLYRLGEKYPSSLLTKGCHENDELNEIVSTIEDEAVRRTLSDKNIGMLRQWINEEKITDTSRLITNEDIKYWLTQR